MKKIGLKLEELAVESFAVQTGATPGAGTVDAFESETDTCVGPSCRRACPTDGGTCNTCIGDPDPTCGGYCTDYYPSCASGCDEC